MLAWWNEMTVLEQVFACIAIAATLVLAIQSILLLFGIGFDSPDIDAGGMDGDFDVADMDGLSLFTVRGLVAFFAVGGWTGLALLKCMSPVWAILLAFVAGTAALFVIALLFRYAFRLQDRGNMNIQNAVGKTAKVYIPIPAQGGGGGKITVMFQERLTELDAVTQEKKMIPTGTLVKVQAVIDEQTVEVEPLESDFNQQDRGGVSKWIQS